MATNSPFRTSNDLVYEALANLGVLAAGQSVDPTDFSAVSEKLDSIFRKLAALEICYVPDANNIPGAWFSDLADIVAGECAMKFGSNADHYSMLIMRGLGGVGEVPVGAGAAAQSLKQMTRGRPTYESLRTESF
jgi:hypothetical protein